MTPGRHTDEIRARLDTIKREKRARINWRITHHTAELAIRAIEGHVSFTYRPGSKSRRRKRHKRML
jgi:hypothetical protein